MPLVLGKDFAPGIPEQHDLMVAQHAKWETHELQFVLLVWDNIKQRIFDARNELNGVVHTYKSQREFTQDQHLALFVEQDWGMDYTRAQVAPYVAIHISQVNDKLAGYPKSRYMDQDDLITYVVDLIDWKNFNVTGEFQDVETIAMAVDTRYQMEKNL